MTEKINDLLPTTPDMQAERLQELKRLFPDLFDGEGQLKLDEIKQLTGDEPQCRERYDFSWYGKRKAKEVAYTPTTATLSYDEKRSVNPEKADGNLIIEGENLETLKTLLSAYHKSIKCIYIDPPYNTGKDFVYSDNYTEGKRAYWEETGGLEKGVKVDTNPETAGRYHSNWLSMMYSRLLLARQLLKDEGVIFVSIDDNEVHNLRRLMDDVFGEENFLSQFIWNTEGNTDNQFKVKINHEYVIAFCKNIEKAESAIGYIIDPNTPEDSNLRKGYADNNINKNNPENPPSVIELPIGFPSSEESLFYKSKDLDNEFFSIASKDKYISDSLKLKYSIESKSGLPIKLDDLVVEDYKLKKSCRIFVGVANKNKLIEFINNNFQAISDDDGSEIKFYINSNAAVRYRKKRDKARNILSVLRGFGTTEKNKTDLKKKGIFFDYPKPKELIKYLIQIGCEDKNETILDCFSGSGTSAQSICELNEEDNGNRKFILVQLPEQTPEKSEARKAGYNKISDITIERVKRVIQGYGDSPQPINTGFKVYQLTKSHFPRTEFKPDPEKTEAENIKALKTYIKEKEKQLTGLFEPTDIQDEVLLKNGFQLNYKLTKVSEFKHNKVKLADDGENKSLLCLDSKLNPDTVQQLIKSPQKFICLERSLSTDDKWNLRQHLKHEFIAF
jgi:adenine-specific DNA-methyltransferase